MGLFGPKKLKIIDRIWMDDEHKTKDIISAIRSSKSQGLMPLVVFHFNESGSTLIDFFKTEGFQIHKLTSLSELDTSTPEAWAKRADAIVFDSNLITKSDISGGKHRFLKKQHAFTLHLIERYPIPGPDERILAFVNQRKDIAAPKAYIALSEPWLVEIMGDRIFDLMEKLDIDENECLEHPFLSRSIRNAQEKMSEKVRRDYPYDSIEEWLKKNIQA